MDEYDVDLAAVVGSVNDIEPQWPRLGKLPTG